MAGCCYGRPTDLPWAVTFTDPQTLGPLGVPVHPTQLYESLLYMLVFGFILWLRKRKSFQGELFGSYLLLAGLARFIVEFFRGDPRGPAEFAGMPVTQVTALVTALVGAFLLVLGFSRLLPGRTLPPPLLAP
jgi:phosphatidylglycerol:prolipoprotein diacylglycerol transferase